MALRCACALVAAQRCRTMRCRNAVALLTHQCALLARSNFGTALALLQQHPAAARREPQVLISAHMTTPLSRAYALLTARHCRATRAAGLPMLAARMVRPSSRVCALPTARRCRAMRAAGRNQRACPGALPSAHCRRRHLQRPCCAACLCRGEGVWAAWRRAAAAAAVTVRAGAQTSAAHAPAHTMALD